MGRQLLLTFEVTVPHEIKHIGLIDNTEQVRDEERSRVTNTVIIVRWLSIFFCIACWYGVYKLVQLFIS